MTDLPAGPPSAPAVSLPGMLARYVPAAVLARTADAGAVIAVVLAVTEIGGSGWQAGALAACLTAPHLTGPLIARRLDLAADGRKVIAAACLGHALLLGAATLTLPVAPLWVSGLLLAGAGVCGPLLTGGISSQLLAWTGAPTTDDEDQARVTRRRAQGWDVASYGLAGSMAPAAVAAAASLAGARLALLLLIISTTVAAVLVLLLPSPQADRAPDAGDVPGALATLGLIWRSAPLRRTLALTIAVAASVAALPVAAVRSAGDIGLTAATGALLVTCYGAGNLTGSLLLIARPLRGVPDVLTGRLALTIVAGLLGALAAPGVPLLAAAYLLTGLLNAQFFAATLAARTEYAPPAVRTQVFVWVAALKITAGSAGTAVAGTLSDLGYHVAVGTAAALVGLAGLTALLGRHLQGRTRCPSGSSPVLPAALDRLPPAS